MSLNCHMDGLSTKFCNKCETELPTSAFHSDKRRPDNLYPYCKDCRRKYIGAKKRREKEPRNCHYCNAVFYPRLEQINKNKKFFCTQEHNKLWQIETRNTFGKEYKNHIIERDGGECVSCNMNKNLHVHHIKFRSQGGGNDYHNLITLCAFCHQTKAHGANNQMWAKTFKVYTSQFETPEWWDAVKEYSEYRQEEAKKYKRNKKKNDYKKIKQSDSYTEYKRKEKERYNKRKEQFKQQFGVSYQVYRNRIYSFSKENQLPYRDAELKINENEKLFYAIFPKATFKRVKELYQ